MDIPKQIESQMEEGERLVGYMKNLFGEELYFTKFGCHTTEGCRNYIYRSEINFSKEDLSQLDQSDLCKYQRRFVNAFIWN